jgi:hypothetical protein
MDWEPLILAVVIFDILLSIWLARMLVFSLKSEVAALDAKLAEALRGIIEQGIGDFEPPNPIQLALGELLKSKMQATIETPEILRTVEGKFTGTKINE